MKNKFNISLILLLAFLAYYVLDELYFQQVRTFFHGAINNLPLSHAIAYTILGLPLISTILFINSPKNLASAMGLNKSFITALFIALICTLPMFLGYASLSNFEISLSSRTFWIAVVFAAFFEELYFRGFLFGQLIKKAKWGFIPAASIGALLFGILHLYQGNTLSEVLGVFFITFLGAGLFAWTYVEWEFNLWVPVLLHLCMNLSWEMFTIADNALGGIWPNIFRIATIVMIILGTRIYKRKKGLPFNITRQTLWTQP